MTRPWSRAGRVVLIRDITASDRERLPDWRDDAPPHDGSLAVAAMAVMALAGFLLGFIVGVLVVA